MLCLAAAPRTFVRNVTQAWAEYALAWSDIQVEAARGIATAAPSALEAHANGSTCGARNVRRSPSLGLTNRGARWFTSTIRYRVLPGRSIGYAQLVPCDVVERLR